MIALVLAIAALMLAIAAHRPTNALCDSAGFCAGDRQNVEREDF